MSRHEDHYSGWIEGTNRRAESSPLWVALLIGVPLGILLLWMVGVL